MFIGFDYGTANCSVAKMEHGKPELLKLEDDNVYIPSTLAAPTRESVAEYLFKFRDIKPYDAIGEQVLRRAIAFNREESIELEASDLAFGNAALDLYLEEPSDTYYVKSPKSFLGASGLRDVQVSFFEDLVCAMMDNIKRNAEAHANHIITDTVIAVRLTSTVETAKRPTNKQKVFCLKRPNARVSKMLSFSLSLSQLDWNTKLHLAITKPCWW